MNLHPRNTLDANERPPVTFSFPTCPNLIVIQQAHCSPDENVFAWYKLRLVSLRNKVSNLSKLDSNSASLPDENIFSWYELRLVSLRNKVSIKDDV